MSKLLRKKLLKWKQYTMKISNERNRSLRISETKVVEPTLQIIYNWENAS